MQDHFLFDDDDYKQRGIGCDKLGTKKDGLKFKWSWERKGKGKPNQCCYAEVTRLWGLEVIFWHCEYEAGVRHCDDMIVHWHKHYDDTYPGKVLVSRLQAQLKAEQLMLEICSEINSVLKSKGLIK